jgi:acetyl esterase
VEDPPVPLDPQVRAVLDFMASLGIRDISEGTVEQARNFSNARIASLPPGPDAEVATRSVHGPAGEIGVRVYGPNGGRGALPCLVWIHGGGFVLGRLDDADANCRQLATRANVVVVSVDYRLAPENPFPAALEDCYAVVRWVHEHAAELSVLPERLAVGGDSAGGNLAFGVALRCRYGGPALAFLLLVYPVADLTRFDTPSYFENAQGYFLTRSGMQWFADHYVEASRRHEPEVSPLTTPDFSGLPKTLVITAEYDPLRDEGEALAAGLSKAGVSTTVTRYDGMIHGFFTMHAFIGAGMTAIEEAATALAEALR